MSEKLRKCEDLLNDIRSKNLGLQSAMSEVMLEMVSDRDEILNTEKCYQLLEQAIKDYGM